jgi:hypothetical protein
MTSKAIKIKQPQAIFLLRLRASYSGVGSTSIPSFYLFYNSSAVGGGKLAPGPAFKMITENGGATLRYGS